MARKNNLRSEASASIHFDARTKTVMAEATHENIKEKVQAVREVVLGKSNNEVVLVLQYYDYNVERAIQAYLEDGAKEALTEWNFTGSKQPNKKRKNKKKTNGEKANDKSGSTPSAVPANGKGEPSVNGKVGLPNGDIGHSVSQSETESPLDSPTSPPVSSIPDVATASPSSTSTTTAMVEKKGAEQPLPQRQHANKGRGHGDSHTAHGHPNHGHSSHGHSNRERTVSEMSTGSGMGDAHHKKGLEKAIKDLHRQTTSLERLRHLLDHEIDRSYKSMKNVFEELRKGLNDREAQLVVEMDQLKTEASEMLEMRQNRALDLKRQVDRADRLKDTQVSDLKAEIKHFVSERRHDEALGRTTRFLFDSDHMLDEMKKFGEVIHVKSLYTTRRASASSVASSVSHDGHQEDDMSQSQEVNQLQDRLKNSLKLENSPSRGPSSASHQSSTQNGSSDADFIRTKNRRRQQNSQQSAKSDNSYRGTHSVSTSLDVNSNKATISSSPPSSPSSPAANDNKSRGPSAYSNTGSPGRGGRGGGQGPRGGGRGRGRGGRGGGRGRGGGQDYRGGERSRPQSSQGSNPSRPQSGNNSRADNRPTNSTTS